MTTLVGMHRNGEAFIDAVRTGEASTAFWLSRGFALVAAVIGPLPLVLDLVWHVGMSSTAPVLSPLSIMLTIASAWVARRSGDTQFTSIVTAAIIAGAMATATYDSTRVAGMSAGVTAMDEALDFGMRLTGQTAPGSGHGAHGNQSGAHETPKTSDHAGAAAPHDETHTDRRQPSTAQQAAEGSQHSTAPSRATVAIGYAWHYWAGIMFALSFLVLFGAGRWWWAIPFLVFVIYPGMVFAMGSHSAPNFIWEAVGHAAFGLTLGIASRALLIGPDDRTNDVVAIRP